MKRIGLLTSGGDCPGLNAAIWAVINRATEYGWEVIGIPYGTRGLLDRPLEPRVLTRAHVRQGLIMQGGTILGTTNKGNPFSYPMEDGSVKDRSLEVVEGFRELGLDALVGIGGDGSLEILRKLCNIGDICFVGIPKTIDNDVAATERAIGFSTAVDIATEALDRLQPTAASHDRVMILEVMGRDAGHIALNAGIAGGADIILIPEIPYSLDVISDHIHKLRAQGQRSALIIVSEALKTEAGRPLMIKDQEGRTRYGGVGHYLADEIQKRTGAETRFTVLGHVQRGGVPSAQDRILAAAFGVHAVDLIQQKKYDRMVAWKNSQVTDVPLQQVVGLLNHVNLDDPLLKTARSLGVCLGN